MGIRSDKEIYRALETRLREAQKPITCVDLMDDPDFRATAIAEYGKDIRVTTNKVSDALGLMWRRNLLVRYPAPRETSSLARYAYIWGKGKGISKLTPVPPPSSSKSGVNVVEQDDGVLIEFDKFTVCRTGGKSESLRSHDRESGRRVRSHRAVQTTPLCQRMGRRMARRPGLVGLTTEA